MTIASRHDKALQTLKPSKRKLFFLALLIGGITIIVYLFYPLDTVVGHKIDPTWFFDPIQTDSWQNLQFDKEKSDVFAFIHIQKTGGTTMEKHLVLNIENSNCQCQKSKRPSCNCYRKNSSEVWLLCRYNIPRWPCGLHPDLMTVRECAPNFMNRTHGKKRRQYFYATILRNPVERFLSEFRHMQRGATWELASSLCQGRRLMEQNKKCFKGDSWSDLDLNNFLNCKSNFAINRQTWMLSDISQLGCNFSEVMSQPQKQKQLLNLAKKNLRRIEYFALLEFPKESQFVFEKTFGLKFNEPFVKWDTGFTKEFLNSSKGVEDLIPKIKTLNSLDIQLYQFAMFEFFRRYRYFVNLHGKPQYRTPSQTSRFTNTRKRKSRLKDNLPSQNKEERLKKRRNSKNSKTSAIETDASKSSGIF